MPITDAQLLAMQLRLEKNRKLPPRPISGESPTREVGKGGLHEQIMRWCDEQWPKWKYVHSRTDKKSTTALGAPDFVIFCPAGKLLLIECKMPGKKRSPEQLAWSILLERLGHKIELVTSMAEFLKFTVLRRM